MVGGPCARPARPHRVGFPEQYSLSWRNSQNLDTPALLLLLLRLWPGPLLYLSLDRRGREHEQVWVWQCRSVLVLGCELV